MDISPNSDMDISPKIKNEDQQPRVMFYDELKYVENCNNETKVYVTCEPLNLDKLYRKRAPLVVHTPHQNGSSGSYNDVVQGEICAPCHTQDERTVVVRNLKPEFVNKGVDVSETILTVRMSDIGVGPNVYAVTRTGFVMEKFDYDLDAVLDIPDLMPLMVYNIAQQINGLVRRLVDNHFVLGDLKTANTVVNIVDDGCELRFIDFDDQWTWEFENDNDRDLYAAIMYYHYFMFVKTWKSGDLLRDFMKPIAQEHLNRVRNMPDGPESFDTISVDMFQDFAPTYYKCNYNLDNINADPNLPHVGNIYQKALLDLDMAPRNVVVGEEDDILV